MKPKINIYFIFILLAAGMWGTAGIFVRTVENTGISEMQIVLLRAVFSSVALGLIMLFKDKELFKVRMKDIWLFISAGILSIVLFNYCYYKTMSMTSLSVAAVLLYTAPFFVVILSSFLFRQKLTAKKCISCLCAFIGCCFVSGVFNSAQRISGKALIFGLFTGFGYSLYTILSSILIKKGYNSLTITFYTFLFAAIGCLPLSDITNTVRIMIISKNGLIITFLMAIFNTVIPYILYTVGLTGVEASIAPIIATVEPVVATLIGIAVYHEKMTVSGCLGILLVLLSVLILNLKAGKTDDTVNTSGKCKNQSDTWNNRQAGRRIS